MPCDSPSMISGSLNGTPPTAIWCFANPRLHSSSLTMRNQNQDEDTYVSTPLPFTSTSAQICSKMRSSIESRPCVQRRKFLNSRLSKTLPVRTRKTRGNEIILVSIFIPNLESNCEVNNKSNINLIQSYLSTMDPRESKEIPEANSLTMRKYAINAEPCTPKIHNAVAIGVEHSEGVLNEKRIGNPKVVQFLGKLFCIVSETDTARNTHQESILDGWCTCA